MGGSKGGGDTKVKPTAAQIAQEEVAWKGWQDYKNILRPAEDNFMEKVDDLNSEQQYDNIAGTTKRRWGWNSNDSSCRNTTSDGLSITICWRAISL